MKGRQRVNEQTQLDQTQFEQTNQDQNNFDRTDDNQLQQTLSDEPGQNDQSTNESVQDATAQKPTKQELNFRELREQAKQAKRERDELKAYLERLKQQENPGNWQPEKQKPEPEDDYNLREDDFIEGRHFKKFLKKQRELEEKVKQYESQSQSISVEMQLKSKYRDFDDVVNQKTVDKLRDEYPEVFTTIQTSSDLYNKGAAAYRIIKQLGLAGNNTPKTEQQIIKGNNAKPQNPNTSSAPNSPLNQANLFANGLTPELKEKLRRANLEAIRRRNS
jgi:hypothetical protein